MQKILEIKNSNERNSIHMMGHNLCLVEVTGLTTAHLPDESTSEHVVYKFDDGSIPPCYCFGWYDYDPKSVKIVHDLSFFGNLFMMTEEDTATMEAFIRDTATQLQLIIVPMENGTVFVSSYVNEFAANGYTKDKFEEAKATNREVAMAAGSAGPATLLSEIVKTGMRRYNKLNFDDKVIDLVKIVKSCSFIDDDGERKSVSFTGVENMLNRVKDLLYVSTEN